MRQFPSLAVSIRLLRRTGVSGLVASLLVAGVAEADLGDMLGFRSRANSVAVLANGQILVAGASYPEDDYVSIGDVALTRLNPDGSPDTSFGVNGVVIADLGSPYDYISDMAVQPDGAIVVSVSGSTGYISVNESFTVARFLANGQLDASFGSGGIVTSVFDESNASAHAVVIQDDGKIVAAGFSSIEDGVGTRARVIRLESDGSFDPMFGTGGVAVLPNGATFSRVVDLALQSDGKIVAVGRGAAGAPGEQYSVFRYNLDGSLDGSFDSDGIATAPLTGDSLSVAVQNDQKLVVAGVETNTGNHRLTLARFNSDGSLDSSFGTAGLAGRTIDWSAYSNPDTVNMALQSDGKIVAGGNCEIGFALVRFLPDGTVDLGFTPHNQYELPIHNQRSGSACGLALQNDDKVLLTGSALHGTNESFATVRYTTTGLIDSEFDADGSVVESDCRSLPLPSSICLAPRIASLQMSSRRATGGEWRYTLSWRWAGHEVFDHASIGTPGVDTRFSMCIYDSSGGTLRLATWLDLYESADWLSYPPKGWSYRNLQAGTRDGAKRIRLRSAPEGGTSQARLRAFSTYALPFPSEFSDTQLMEMDPRVVVQFVGSNGFCLTSEFTIDDSQENTPTSFKAKAR